MTIDEAIAKEKEMSEPCSTLCANGYDCTKCRKGHEQLAEWLEELKFRRVLQLQCEKEYFSGYEKGKNEGYNKGYADGSLSVTEEIRGKAIDDFVNACKEDILCQTFGLHQNGIERIAEQLKAGGENND